MLYSLRKELHILLTAVMFYTRIPCPRWVGHDPEYLTLATRYFPFMGWLVGAFAAGVLWLAGLVLPTGPAVCLSMAATVLLTGAFHEDGFADVCDGFGGGWTREKILEIMKDSRIGAYGAIGLVLILLAKFVTLSSIPFSVLLPGLIAAHALSRFCAATLIATLPYAREDLASKARPVAQGITPGGLVVAGIFGLLPLAWLAYNYSGWVLLVLPLLAGLLLYLRGYYKKWLGGYTGDCLGAAQQLSELLIYLALAALPALIFHLHSL